MKESKKQTSQRKEKLTFFQLSKFPLSDAITTKRDAEQSTITLFENTKVDLLLYSNEKTRRISIALRGFMTKQNARNAQLTKFRKSQHHYRKTSNHTVQRQGRDLHRANPFHHQQHQ